MSVSPSQTASRETAHARSTRRASRPWRAMFSSRVLVHAVLILGAVVMVGPLIWMVLTSLKTPVDAEAFFDTPRRLSLSLRHR